MLKNLLIVFLGGGVGSVCRLLLGKFYAHWQPAFPFATLTANFLSCVVFGAIMMLGVEKTNLSYSLKLLLITGFCGGFSTYSSFTFETIELFKSGQNSFAIANIVLNFTLSVCGLLGGTALIKFFM